MADGLKTNPHASGDGGPHEESNAMIFFKQLLVVSGPWVGYYMCGLSIGSTTVLAPQLRADASFNATIGDDATSWLASAHTYSGVLGIFVLCTLSGCLGRRLTFLLVSLSALAGYLLFYCSGTVAQILISELALGLLFGCQSSLSMLVLTEYTSPKYRGVFLATKVALYFWGVWTANAVGTFSDWRNIPVAGVACSLYLAGTVLLWPESPYWLASRARYGACAASHRWLKGRGADAEMELRALISVQRELHSGARDENAQTNVQVEYKQNYVKPILLAVLLMSLYSLSGKIVCSVYAIEIIKRITMNEEAAYTGMLALDGITVLSMYVAAGLSRVLRRRTLLLTSASVAIVLLYAISLYLYLTSAGLLSENKYAVLVLLSMFSVSVSCGPVNMCTTIYGELIPLRRRCATIMVVGMLSNTILATVVKLSPLLFSLLRLHGAFAFYGVSSSVCVMLLYKYLPETKDRTLQEIQDCINGGPIDRDGETKGLI